MRPDSVTTGTCRAARSRAPALLLPAAALLAGFLTPPPAASQELGWLPVPDGYPTTAAEETGFERHTSHLEMWEYLEALDAASTEMRLGSYGRTHAGRDLPYAVFGRPLVAEPWEAHLLDRPVVLLAANVHGNERTFREGLLVLMRDLATPGTPANDLLDRVTVVVAPQINPDGFEAAERGQRGNAWGIDLNRDYVKLEQPAIVHYVGELIGGWRPHVYVDGHDGGSRPYNLNYQCPSHYDGPREITDFCDERIFPAIDRMLASEGLKSFFYSGGDEEAWRGGNYQARIGRNYGGFVNAIGILFESPRQDLETGARAGYLGYLAVTRFAAEHPDAVMGVVRDAALETIALGAEPRGEIAVEMEYEAEDELVSYEIVREGEGGEEEIVRITDAELLKKPVALRTRPRPWAYLLPRDAVDAVRMLLRHGITVERLTEGVELEVDAYEVGGVTHERAYNHAAATIVEVAGVVTLEEAFPEGTYVVPTAQLLGRLVGHMLEPETDDNVVYWNTMDAWLPRGPETIRTFEEGEVQESVRPPLVPIYKVMAPTPLPTMLVEEMGR